jgi:cation:H+ antiporter
VSLPHALILVALGLALLTGGGEALVRGASTIARVAGVTPAVVGLTVVALGTSMPELAVGLLAAAREQPDIAIGNVVGSNIFNVAAILGLTGLVTALPVHGTAVRLEWPFMFLASCAGLLVMRDGVVDRVEGGVFVVALVLFTTYMVRLARREVSGPERQEFADAAEDRSMRRSGTPRVELRGALGLVVVGMVLLVLGGRWLVDGATGVARTAGLSERLIGLTVVAAGTGAPELATSLVAALRGRTDVAVANVVGSNIFNLLGVLGLTALVQPIPVAPAVIASDAWWMLGTALLLYPLLRSGMRLTRVESGVLLATYVAYVGLLVRGAR